MNVCVYIYVYFCEFLPLGICFEQFPSLSYEIHCNKENECYEITVKLLVKAILH